jgi:hypothetical protein
MYIYIYIYIYILSVRVHFTSEHHALAHTHTLVHLSQINSASPRTSAHVCALEAFGSDTHTEGRFHPATAVCQLTAPVTTCLSVPMALVHVRHRLLFHTA